MRPLIEARHYISNETRGHTSTHHQLKSVCMSVCITLNAGILGRPDVKTQLIKYFVFLIVVNPIKLKVSLLSSLRLCFLLAQIQGHPEVTDWPSLVSFLGMHTALYMSTAF